MHDTTVHVDAGQEILGLLRTAGQHAEVALSGAQQTSILSALSSSSGVATGGVLVLSRDEYLLSELERRESAETGADFANEETFADAATGEEWDEERMMATGHQLLRPGTLAPQGQARGLLPALASWCAFDGGWGGLGRCRAVPRGHVRRPAY